jgi:hypothetical protein
MRLERIPNDGIAIYKSANQPDTGDTIYMGLRTRDPYFSFSSCLFKTVSVSEQFLLSLT